MTEHLFQPSLSSVRNEQPLYSTTTLFLAAFFGGGLAAACVFAVNLQRAQRLRPDAWLLALGVAVAIAAPFALLAAGLVMDAKGLRLPLRVIGLALAAGFYWRQRALYRGQDLFGVERPNGLALGLGAIAAAYVANLVLITLALSQTSLLDTSL